MKFLGERTSKSRTRWYPYKIPHLLTGSGQSSHALGMFALKFITGRPKGAILTNFIGIWKAMVNSLIHDVNPSQLGEAQ